MVSFFLQSSLGEYTAPKGLPGGDDGFFAGIFAHLQDIVLYIAISIAVAMLIIGGIQYTLAAGDDEKKAQAKRTFKWTLFGLLLAVVAYGIVRLIIQIFSSK